MTYISADTWDYVPQSNGGYDIVQHEMPLRIIGWAYREHNAHAIAKVPEMVKALERALQWAEAHTNLYWQEHEWPAEVRVVLAKVKGESDGK